MKNNIITIFFCILILVIWNACSINNDSKTRSDKIEQDSLKILSQKDSLHACSKLIKDPNNSKPMALMMRILAANADSMRHQLLRGESLTSERYPFVHFYLVEPTDPKVLEPQFFENARLFKIAYTDVFKHRKEQKKYYNLMINGCIKCHESYCSGPLKRIRKFPIE
ncbi:MAG: hypothetical protein H7296_05290 [Bacteroidia bacterium]|nr:hypothetical protein [Bacteroidia bacterium]